MIPVTFAPFGGEIVPEAELEPPLMTRRSVAVPQDWGRRNRPLPQ